MTDPAFRYIVIRPASDLPEGLLPDRLNGMWLNLDNLPYTLQDSFNAFYPGMVVVDSGKFERREELRISLETIDGMNRRD